MVSGSQVLEKYPELVEAVRDGDVVLFLGAGASIGAKNAAGEDIPLGPSLGRLIADRFLGPDYKDLDFKTIYDLAMSQTGARNVQEYVRDQLLEYEPAYHHKLASTFRWSGIVSTNYDQIVERAYSEAAGAVQKLRPIRDDTDFTEDPGSELLLVKIHGCISRFENTEIPFIGSTEQLIGHEYGRKSQVQMFMEWAQTKFVVFAGYGMQDPNLRTLYHKIIKDGDNHPPHYIVDPNLLPIAENYWHERRVRPLKLSFEDFLVALDEKIPPNSRKLSGAISIPDATSFTKFISKPNVLESSGLRRYLTEHVTVVSGLLRNQSGTPREFYRGDSTGWAAVSNSWDIQRGATRSAILEEVNESRKDNVRFVVLKGAAGSGKTVALKRIAWDAAAKDHLCIFVSSNSHISIEYFEEIFSLTNRRLFLFVDTVSAFEKPLENLIENARKRGWLLTVFGAERTSEWNMNCERISALVSNEYSLRRISEAEANSLLDKLSSHGELGSLDSLSRDQQIKKLVSSYGRELLVTLYETTRGADFREIVSDEYQKIWPVVARLLYLDICGLHRFQVPVRAGLISRVHDISFQKFQDDFFQPLEEVVRLRKDRRTGDYVYESRHPVVADIVFSEALSSDEEKYDFLTRIVGKLNVSFSYDADVLRRLISSSALSKWLFDREKIRVVYDTALNSVGMDCYVLHQWGIFEMHSTSNPTELTTAEDLIRRALELEPDNPTIKHSLAELALKRSRLVKPHEERAFWRVEARDLAKPLTTRSRTSHAHHTLAKAAVYELDDAIKAFPDNPSETDERALNEAIQEAEQAIQSGLDKFPDDPHMLDAQAELWKLLRDTQAAERALEAAFESNPAGELITRRLVAMYQASGKTQAAFEVLKRAIEVNPGSQEINWLLATTMRELPPYEEDDAYSDIILYHLKRSFTPRDRKFERQFWYSRQLFLTKHFEEARNHFDALRSASIPWSQRSASRGPIRRKDGSLKEFRGKVARILDGSCFIEIPELAADAYMDTKIEQFEAEPIEEGQEFAVNISFSFFGLVAENPQKSLF